MIFFPRNENQNPQFFIGQKTLSRLHVKIIILLVDQWI